MRRRAGGLDKLRVARVEQIVQNMKAWSGDAYSAEFDDLANPGRKVVDKFTDDELAELIATETTSKQGHIAASIMRSREAWRGPARWALAISVCPYWLRWRRC